MKKFLSVFLMLCLMTSCIFAQTSLSVMEARTDCPAPSNLVVDHIAGSSALLSWTSGVQVENPSYYVEYRNQGSSVWSQEIASSNRLFLAGLQPQTAYDVRVFMQCQDGYSDTANLSFSTTCLAGGPFAVGNGAELVGELPSDAYWNYSLTQQIYTASEMNGATTLESISFDCVIAYSGARNLSVYLMHTNQTAPTSWLPMQDAQLVYSGSVNFVSGWNTLNFTTPFVYNGTENLAVVILDQTGSYSSKNYFNAHVTANTTLLFSSDTEHPTITSLPNTPQSINYRLNTRFGATCNSDVTCVAPNVIVSDVASNAITLEWAPGADEYLWNIEYRLASANTWTAAGTASSSPFTIDNLSPMTSYEIRIVSDCGDEMFSEPVLLDVTTACSGISELPFTENFDALASTEQIPMCWTAGTSQLFATPSANYLANSAPNSMNFDGNANNYAYLALPRLADDFDISNLLVTFYAMRLSNLDPSFEVGVMNDPADVSTFTPIAQAYPATTGPWELMEVSTATYMGTGRYLAFRSNCYIFMDDITVSEAPSCFHISNLTVDNVTATTADLQWTPGAFETDWDVAYGVHGTVNPETASYETVTGAPTASLTGLTPNTYYDVYVRSNCGSQQSEWETISFWSGCELLSVLPYIENFDLAHGSTFGYELANNLPNCWTYLNMGEVNAVYPLVLESPDNAASGTNAVCFATTNLPDCTSQFAILPEVNVQANPMNSLALSFDAKATAYSDLLLVVGVMTDPEVANTFVPVDTVLVDTTIYQTYTVSFASYLGMGSYVAIMAPVAQSNEGYVDNVVLNYYTDCARPAALQLTSLNGTDMQLNWTAADPMQSAWEVEYGPRGFNVGAGEGITSMVYGTPEITLFALGDDIYDFYVRSACDNDEWS
ncbi:MAG: fibronectin type III domain-containing protein, partial [Bacteroidales bacterium]|nr:fibronectin type III domain-containing protein [Bacteroidales bacterium]